MAKKTYTALTTVGLEDRVIQPGEEFEIEQDQGDKLVDAGAAEAKDGSEPKATSEPEPSSEPEPTSEPGPTSEPEPTSEPKVGPKKPRAKE